MYSSLILYVTKILNLNDTQASAITGAFLALNYFLHLISGSMGGRFFSFKGLFVISMLLEISGCLLISIPTINMLYWGLAAFLAGCGLNISCINCLLTQLFTPQDIRREAAFMWNYAGQNIGIFLGFLLAGYFDVNKNYHALFLVSAIGNLFAIIITCASWSSLSEVNTTFSLLSARDKYLQQIKGTFLLGLLVVLIHILLQNTQWCDALIILVTVCIFAYVLSLGTKKMLAYCILAIATIIFWTLILVGPIGLNLYLERNVNLNLAGIQLAPQWVQNVNTFTTIIAAPIMSHLFSRLRQRGLNISIPLQFAIGLLLIGSAYLILPIGIYFSNHAGFSNVNWVLISFILQAIGDLFVSPVGYAMVGRLAPAHLQGLLMGTWLMFGGITGVFADYFSRIALGTTSDLNPLYTNASYSHAFFSLGIVATLAGFFLLALLPWLNHLINAKEPTSLKQSLALL